MVPAAITALCESRLACSACYDEYLRSVTDPDPLQLPRFRSALDAMCETGYRAPLPMLLAQYAMSLRRFGHFVEAQETINEALRRCEATGERWFYPELRRLAAEISHVVDPGKLIQTAALSASASPSGGPPVRQHGHSDRGLGAARPMGAQCYRIRPRAVRSGNG